MNTRLLRVLLPLGVGFICIGLWLLGSFGIDQSDQEAVAKPEFGKPEDAEGDPENAEREAQELESRVAVDGATARGSESEQSAEFGTFIKGRCVDSSGAALAGVRIQSTGLTRIIRTDSDGGFRFAVAMGGLLSRMRNVEFEAPGLGQRVLEVSLRAGSEADLGDVVLLAGARLRGRIVDARGRPIAEVSVIAEDAAWPTRGSRFRGPGKGIAHATSASDGLFTMEDLSPGFVRVWAGAKGMVWISSNRLELEPSFESDAGDLTVVPLDLEDTIELTVVDPSGKPLPYAKVSYTYEQGSRSGNGGGKADEDGRYSKFMNPRTAYCFIASDPEERFGGAVARDIEPGTRDLVMQLGQRSALQLHVRADNGAGIETLTVFTKRKIDSNQTILAPLESLPRSTFELFLLPGKSTISLLADGYAEKRIGTFDPETAPLELDVILTALPGIRGLVRSWEGPLGGARLTLHRKVSDNRRLETNGFPCFSERNVECRAESAADGMFSLTLRDSGEWFVRAEHAGYATGVLGPLQIDAKGGADNLEVVLGQGGAIVGRVLVAADQSPSGLTIAFSRGDGFEITLRTNKSGDYRAEGLTPGDWQVLWRRRSLFLNTTTSSVGSLDGPRVIPWSCSVFEGQETYFDLDLRGQRVANLTGSFRLQGVSTKGWRVSLNPIDAADSNPASTSLEADGSFRLDALSPGSFRLTFGGVLASANIYATTTLNLAAGENQIELDLPTGELRVRVNPELFPEGSPLSLTSTGTPGLTIRGTMHVDAEGESMLPAFPAGRAEIQFSASTGTDDDSGTREFTVTEGGVTDVVIP